MKRDLIPATIPKWLKGVVVLCLVLIWLGLLSFNTIAAPFQGDEGEYAYSAQLLRDGGIPYKEAFMQKPPMIIYTYFLAQTFSRSVAFPRLLSILFLTATCLVLSEVVKKRYNNKAAIILLIIFPALVFFRPFEAISAQPEVFLLLPFAFTLWFYLKAESGDRYAWWLAAAGASSALAVFYKPIVLPPIVFLFFYYLILHRKQKIVNILKCIFSFSFGFISTSLVVLAPITIRGGLGALWEEVVVFNSYYASLMGLHPHFDATLLFFVWVWLALIILFIVRTPGSFYLFGLLIASLVGTGGSFLRHYYIIIVVPLSIICAVAIDNLATLLHDKKLKFASLTSSTFTILFVILLYGPYLQDFTLSPQAIPYKIYGDHQFEASPVVAKEISQITFPHDKVLVDDNAPEILYYSHRKSPTRFVIKFPLTIPTPLAEKYNAEEVSLLEADPPAIIVSTRTPYQLNLINRNIRNATTLDRYLIPTLIKNYEFKKAVIVPDDEQSGIISDPSQLRSYEQRYYIIYQRKSPSYISSQRI